jgi:predicted secreted protein
MSITAIFVVYSMVWFMVFFIVLQVRTVSQADTDHVEPGTPPGAPAHEIVGKKAKVATLIATPIWAVICGIILSGWVTVADLDIFGRMTP